MTSGTPVTLRPAPEGVHVLTAEEAKKPRALVVWLQPSTMADFDDAVVVLREKGYRVLNDSDEVPVDHLTLRDFLVELSDATHLCLPSTWWTSVVAHQLVTIAGWVGIKLIDDTGAPIETVGGRR